MTSARLALAGILTALLTVLGAGAAQAYPDPTITINDGRLVGGNDYEFTADAGGVSCAWTVTYRGQSVTGTGSTFSGSFATPAVDQERSDPVTAACAYEGGQAQGAGTVTLLPVGADLAPAAAIDGALPNAGGSNLWILLVGGALVLIGGGTFVVARRR